jgi:multidrug efflux pump subunit AcrB
MKHEGEAVVPVMLQGMKSKNPEWEKIPIANVKGQIICLTDVATARYTEREATSYYRINGKSTLMLTMEAEKGQNQIKLANTVRSQMSELQKHMPDSWQVILTWDDTDFIRKDLRRVGYRMLFSFIILMLFVLLVSRNPRYLLMIFLTVVTNLVLAVMWYHIFDIEIHLYSLAGITVSFGIIIDNSIVMIEHMRQHKNRKVFLAILAATLTTLGSLSVIFLLSEQQQAQLSDFAAVVLINLALSLLVAWFLIPALLSKLEIKNKVSKMSSGLRRKAIMNRIYFRCITLSRRFAWIIFVVLIAGFGLPLHLLPTKLEGTGTGAVIYNATLGSRFYQHNIKNISEKALGGTFRLFSRFVYERSYFSDPERTTLYVRGHMPDGATVHQLNDAVMQMERFLLEFPQIEQFQTRVTSPDNSMITIRFYPQYDRGSFPHFLQGQIIRKAISIGGAEWGVWGVGQGFSNALGSSGGNSNIILEGYNYSQLYRYGEQLIQKASVNPRMTNMRITGGNLWGSTNRMEFYLETDAQQLALQDLTLADVFDGISEKIMHKTGPGVFYNHEPVPVRLISDYHLKYSLWDMENLPLHIKGEDRKTKQLMSLQKRAMGNDIHKYNQQYRLHVNYSFMGPGQLEERVRNQLVDQMNEILPLGYKARIQTWNWNKEESRQYVLIFLVLIIIYFICAILLESLLQPLAIIGLIPISFAGLFLTFYLFKLNFDQGGWASFILLSGLAVNAGLYILNDFNNLRNNHPDRNHQRLYLKAFRYKITPVLLTIFSTVIGLIPFVTGQREAFWFAFAAGTMGGLIFSLVGIMLFFPVFLRLNSTKRQVKQ